MSKIPSGVAYSGGAVSALLAVLAIVDQSSAHWTRSDVATHYGSYGLHPDPNLLTTLLAVSFFCAALVFALGGACPVPRQEGNCPCSADHSRGVRSGVRCTGVPCRRVRRSGPGDGVAHAALARSRSGHCWSGGHQVTCP